MSVLGEESAKADDAGGCQYKDSVQVSGNVVGFVAQIEEIPVDVDTPLPRWFNERTGTVVIGGNVRVLPAVVSHGNLRVQVMDGSPDSVAHASGETVVPVSARARG